MLLCRQFKERWMHGVFFTIATATILILALISLFLFTEGLPIFGKISVADFLFGEYWYPTADPPDFGIFPLILGSLAVTVLASVVAIPLGVMTVVYLAEIASARIRDVIKPIVELLAALPSVVIGFFGMVIFAPFLQNTFDLATGLNIFNAAIKASAGGTATSRTGIGYLINLPLISRHLERLGDHATNIAEEVIYLIEGEIIRPGKC